MSMYHILQKCMQGVASNISILYCVAYKAYTPYTVGCNYDVKIVNASTWLHKMHPSEGRASDWPGVAGRDIV